MIEKNNPLLDIRTGSQRNKPAEWVVIQTYRRKQRWRCRRAKEAGLDQLRLTTISLLTVQQQKHLIYIYEMIMGFDQSKKKKKTKDIIKREIALKYKPAFNITYT